MKVGSWYKVKNKQSGCGSALLKRKWMSYVEYLLNECKWKLQYGFLSHTPALLSLPPLTLSFSLFFSLPSLSLCLSLSHLFSVPHLSSLSVSLFTSFWSIELSDSSQYWELSCWEALKSSPPHFFPGPVLVDQTLLLTSPVLSLCPGLQWVHGSFSWKICSHSYCAKLTLTHKQIVFLVMWNYSFEPRKYWRVGAVKLWHKPQSCLEMWRNGVVGQKTTEALGSLSR